MKVQKCLFWLHSVIFWNFCISNRAITSTKVPLTILFNVKRNIYSLDIKQKLSQNVYISEKWHFRSLQSNLLPTLPNNLWNTCKSLRLIRNVTSKFQLNYCKYVAISYKFLKTRYYRGGLWCPALWFIRKTIAKDLWNWVGYSVIGYLS